MTPGILIDAEYPVGGLEIGSGEQMGIDSIHAVPGLDFLPPLAVMFRRDDGEIRDAFDHGVRTIREHGRYAAIV